MKARHLCRNLLVINQEERFGNVECVARFARGAPSRSHISKTLNSRGGVVIFVGGRGPSGGVGGPGGALYVHTVSSGSLGKLRKLQGT